MKVTLLFFSRNIKVLLEMHKVVVFGVILGCLLLLVNGLPTENQRQNSIVFNVWEYARVAGPRPQVAPKESKPALPTPVDTTTSPCVWAITSCCHATNTARRSRCFDALGCGGAWFSNLCKRELLEAALGSIL